MIKIYLRSANDLRAFWTLRVYKADRCWSEVRAGQKCLLWETAGKVYGVESSPAHKVELIAEGEG